MIPNGWSVALVRDLCTLESGNGFKPADWKSSGLPIIRIQNLNGSKEFNYFQGHPEKRWLVEPGQILFAWAGVKGVSFGPKIWNGPRGVLNQHIFKVHPKPGVEKSWLYLALMDVTQRIEENAHGFKSSLLHVRRDDILDQEVGVPTPAEQARISKAVASWEVAISTTESMISAKQQRKQALVQQLLTGKIRLPGFSGLRGDTSSNFGRIPNDWRLLKIADFSEQISERNTADDALPVLSCTKHHGLVDSLSYFGKRVFSEDTSGYKVVPRNTFAYATNHIEEGSIGYQNLYDSALISPIYTVFRCEPKMIHDAYLLRVLKTETARHIFESMTSSSVDRRGSLRWNDFSTITLPIPSIAEQKRLDQFFSTVDRELTLLEAKKAALETQKKALMAVLLTGKKRLKV